MIGGRTIWVKRHSSSELDVEGRPVAGSLSTVATVSGHLFSRSIDATSDGRIVISNTVRALLPIGTDVQVSDVLELDGVPGVLYRVKSIMSRRSPFGGDHHLSLDCEMSN